MRRSLVSVAVVAVLILAGCGSSPPQLPYGAAGAGTEAAAADMSMRVANIRYELADGVTADKDKQNAYKQSAASRADAERLAKAFAIPGEIRSDEGGWSVGATGEEPAAPNTKGNLSLYLSKNGSWSMNGDSPVSSGVACAEPDRVEGSDAIPSGPACPTTTTTRPPNMPSESEARALATRTLAAAGIDVDGMRATVEQFDLVISVRFQPVFDGQPVDGYEFGVTVNSEGDIAYANGYIGDMDSVGTYELATLQRAVERLNEQQAYPGGDDYRTMTADAVGAPEPAIAPEEPAPENSEPTVVELTAVRVGLMMTFEDNGAALWLTPAYIFKTDGHGDVIAAAADDEYLPPPTTQPAPSDTKPGGTEPAPSDGGSGGSTGSGGGSTGSGGSVEPSPPQSNCTSTSGPIEATVCSDKASYTAGENVVFRISAFDPDRAFTQGPCGDGVSAEYGDDGDGDVRCLACSTTVAEGPGKVDVERKHTYAKTGTFTAKFTIKSGAECGDPHPNDSSVTLSLPVRVA